MNSTGMFILRISLRNTERKLFREKVLNIQCFYQKLIIFLYTNCSPYQEETSLVFACRFCDCFIDTERYYKSFINTVYELFFKKKKN